MKLKDKVALVTGGRGGIGRAICARFVKEGATVYATDLSDRGSMEDAAEDGTRFVRLDVTSEEEAQAAMARVGAEQGRLDVLVNAAGIEIEHTIEETSLADWNRIFAINVTGTFLASKHALPLLRVGAASGASASIINFGSYDGFIADPDGGVDWLNEIQFFGFKFGFWWAQQGSIYVFVILIFVYTARMKKIDREHGVSDEDDA